MMTQKESVTISFAFEQNYHADKSNAAIHCSPVRFSPLTFRLAEILTDTAFKYDPGVQEVLQDLGSYPEDKGRIADDA